MIFFQINPKVLKDFLEILHRQLLRVQETFFYVKIPRLVASFNSFCNFFQRRIAIAFMDANPYLVFLIFNLVTRKPKQILLKLFYSSLINNFFHYRGEKKPFSFNLFQANVPFLYPLKTSENRRLSNVFRGYRNGTLA